MINDRKKISIIIVSRDDNYGGDSLGELDLCLKSINDSLKDSSYEILLVDYRPPDGKYLSDHFKNRKNIRHIVFDESLFQEFKRKHLNFGAKIKYEDGEDVSEDKIDKFNYSYEIGFNYAFNFSNGEYLLCASANDMIYNGNFYKIIENIKPNILYKSKCFYMDYKNSIKCYNNLLSKFDKNNIKSKYRKHWKNTGFIWNRIIDFGLIDRNSIIDIGGFPPLLMKTHWLSDAFIFYKLCLYGKKIFHFCKEDFITFTICGKQLYLLSKKIDNYIIENNNFRYIYKNELKNKNYKKFEKIAMTRRNPAISSYIDVFKDIYNKKEIRRNENNKKMFEIMLGEKFIPYVRL